jgi:hypothetical protein
MDITLAMLPWKLIWGLQMRRQEKVGVAFAMSCGLFAGITAIIKTTKITAMLSADFCKWHRQDRPEWALTERVGDQS